MIETQIATEPTVGTPRHHHERIVVEPRSGSEFVDITDCVTQAGPEFRSSVRHCQRPDTSHHDRDHRQRTTSPSCSTTWPGCSIGWRRPPRSTDTTT